MERKERKLGGKNMTKRINLDCEGWKNGIPCEKCNVIKKCKEDPTMEQNHHEYNKDIEEKKIARFLTQSKAGKDIIENYATDNMGNIVWTKIIKAIRNPKSELGDRIYTEYFNHYIKHVEL